jgi:Domain of unknown function (DUF4281)
VAWERSCRLIWRRYKTSSHCIHGPSTCWCEPRPPFVHITSRVSICSDTTKLATSQMALAPQAAFTRRLLLSGVSLLPLAAVYGVLLILAWTPDTLATLFPGSWAAGFEALMAGKPEMQFVPSVKAVGHLFSRPVAAVSAWTHLQFISFFCARWIWMDGALPIAGWLPAITDHGSCR